MDVARSMHVEARVVHAIGYVRARESKVLKCSSDVAVERSVCCRLVRIDRLAVIDYMYKYLYIEHIMN